MIRNKLKKSERCINKNEKGAALVSFLIGFFVFILGCVSGYVIWGTEDFSMGPFEFKKSGQEQFQEFFDVETGQWESVENVIPETNVGEYLANKFTEAELNGYLNSLEEPSSLFQELSYDDSIITAESPFSIDSIKFYYIFNKGNNDYKVRMIMSSAGRIAMDTLGIGKINFKELTYDVDFSTLKVCTLGFCMDGLLMDEIDEMAGTGTDASDIFYTRNEMKQWEYLGNKNIDSMVSPCFARKDEDTGFNNVKMCMHPKYTVALYLETTVAETNDKVKMLSKSLEINQPIADSIFQLE